MSELQADGNSYIEAIRAQRTEHADASAKWFAMYMAAKAALEVSDARVKELVDKYEPKQEPEKAD